MFQSIENNLGRIFRDLNGSNTQLIAVTKTRTADEINCAIRCGVKHIGENRVQELLAKYDDIEKEGVKIHLIGRLQTNKVKYIVDKVDLIHSVDSLKLVAEISKRAAQIGKVQDVLVEINIANEDSKGGILPEDLEEFLKAASVYENVKICGLMCIPPLAVENHQNREHFLKMQELFVDIRGKKLDNIYMDILSMGMSDDYQDAINANSSFIRIGRGIFGARK